MKAICKYLSPLGTVNITSDGQKLTGLWFDGRKNISSCGYTELPLPVFADAKRWLDCYFDGSIPDFTPPLSLTGSPFRLEVWELLSHIPYGKTVSYGELAAQLAHAHAIPKMSAQAVGGAVRDNPISLIIPCHRVIGADGSLTGYAGGIDRKAYLLALERSSVLSNAGPST